MLATETNRYAAQKGGNFLEVTTGEIRCFIGILLISGYIDLPRYTMFWEEATDVNNELVSTAMRRNRFKDIKRFFHCANNEQLDQQDKFSKIRPLFNYLNDKYLEHAPIQRELSVDER